MNVMSAAEQREEADVVLAIVTELVRSLRGRASPVDLDTALEGELGLARATQIADHLRRQGRILASADARMPIAAPEVAPAAEVAASVAPHLRAIHESFASAVALRDQTRACVVRHAGEPDLASAWEPAREAAPRRSPAHGRGGARPRARRGGPRGPTPVEES